MAKRPSYSEEIEQLRTEIEKLRARLEIDHHYVADGDELKRVDEDGDGWPDGIECRDAVIRLLEHCNAEKTDENERLKTALVNIRNWREMGRAVTYAEALLAIERTCDEALRGDDA